MGLKQWFYPSPLLSSLFIINNLKDHLDGGILVVGVGVKILMCAYDDIVLTAEHPLSLHDFSIGKIL